MLENNWRKNENCDKNAYLDKSNNFKDENADSTVSPLGIQNTDLISSEKAIKSELNSAKSVLAEKSEKVAQIED